MPVMQRLATWLLLLLPWPGVRLAAERRQAATDRPMPFCCPVACSGPRTQCRLWMGRYMCREWNGVGVLITQRCRGTSFCLAAVWCSELKSLITLG